jgi:hypothetical protein
MCPHTHRAHTVQSAVGGAVGAAAEGYCTRPCFRVAEAGREADHPCGHGRIAAECDRGILGAGRGAKDEAWGDVRGAAEDEHGVE